MPRLTDRRKLYFYLIILIILVSIHNFKITNNFNNFFNINKIEIKNGLNENLNQNILLSLNKFINSNIFLLKTEELAFLFDKFNLVEEYKIKKKYPSAIEVEVKQTEILAYFLENNQKILIGQNGKEIKDKIISTKDLPILIGTININKFLSLNKLLLENEFNLKDFTRIYYFKSDRWDLEFKNNLIIKLPFNGLDETLKKLKKIYNKNQFNNLKIIDLRVAGRIIVK
ncbi:cell division protein FtsQ/DivIB [Candidatus Pelagibacter sp.]|nr:cell division protein FtsQ/DivIB [Candidatus Pelagibacter sp.]